MFGDVDKWQNVFLLLNMSYTQIYQNTMIRVRFMVFSATLNNISVISSRTGLSVKESGVRRENHQPAASHWQTLSHSHYIFFRIFAYFVDILNAMFIAKQEAILTSQISQYVGRTRQHYMPTFDLTWTKIHNRADNIAFFYFKSNINEIFIF